MSNEQLIKQVRARYDHHRNKNILREKYEAKMLFAYAGGMWRAGPELLAMLEFAPDQDNVILPDDYGNPVKVDYAEFRDLVEMRWQEQMTAWLLEYEENRKLR